MNRNDAMNVLQGVVGVVQVARGPEHPVGQPKGQRGISRESSYFCTEHTLEGGRLDCLLCYPASAGEVKALRALFVQCRESLAERDCACGNIDPLPIANAVRVVEDAA